MEPFCLSSTPLMSNDSPVTILTEDLKSTTGNSSQKRNNYEFYRSFLFQDFDRRICYKAGEFLSLSLSLVCVCVCFFSQSSVVFFFNFCEYVCVVILQRVPPAFMQNFNGEPPKVCFMKSATGRSWGVLMDKNEEGYFFSGGWSKFVKDHRLEAGDFLVFWYIGNSTFEVVIYGRNACEKDTNFVSKERHVKFNKSSRASRIFSRVAAMKRKRSGVHNKTECELKRASKRNRRSTDHEREDSNRRNSDDNKIKSEQRLRFVADEEADLVKPDHPFFVKKIKDYQRFTIVLPKGFAVETGLLLKKRTVLKDPEGRMWPVNVHLLVGCGQVHLSTGWGQFFTEKRLADGDICLFEFIPSTGNVLHVRVLSRGAANGGGNGGTIKEESQQAIIL